MGAELLCQHVRRLADVAPSTPLEQVAAALDELVEQYGILAETKTLNAKAVSAIKTRVEAVRAAVERELS